MGNADRPRRRVPDLVRALGVVGLGWVVLLFLADPFVRRLDRLLFHAAHTGLLDPAGGLRNGLGAGVWYSLHALTGLPTFALLVAATLALPLTLLVRMVARARVRAGLTDPRVRARAWLASHPMATRLLVALPALHWLARMLRSLVNQAHAHYRPDAAYYALIAAFGCVTVATAYGLYRLTSTGVRMVLAESPTPVGAASVPVEQRLTFDAVAVTRETWGAVLAMGILPLAIFGVIQAWDLHDRATLMVLAAYATVAAAGAYAFRRASKVAIGVDGVFVTGSSRTRFFPYRELDEARATASEIELRRRGESVLRLQLHGEDAALKGEVLARLTEAIARARTEGLEGAALVVGSASPREIVDLARGAGDYRAPAVTRERLWEVVEGATHDAATRAHTARALVVTGRVEDVLRLRVAAERCAEPKARVELRELALADEAHEESDAGVRGLASRSG